MMPCPRHIIGLDSEGSQPSRGAVREHDPNELAAMRLVVVETRLHQHFFHCCRKSFRALGIDIEQRRGVANKAWMRFMTRPCQLDPVELMARQR